MRSLLLTCNVLQLSLLVSAISRGDAFFLQTTTTKHEGKMMIDPSRRAIIQTRRAPSPRSKTTTTVLQQQQHLQHYLQMVPKYDSEQMRWSPTSPEEGPEAGYPIYKTLLLHGPSPFFRRLFQPDDYEQGVLKLMASEKWDRIEAMGNMDAYLNNPNDWAYQRYEAQRTGYQPDYTSIDSKQLTLTLVWSSVVLAVIGRAIFALSTGVDFWAFGPFVGSH